MEDYSIKTEWFKGSAKLPQDLVDPLNTASVRADIEAALDNTGFLFDHLANSVDDFEFDEDVLVDSNVNWVSPNGSANLARYRAGTQFVISANTFIYTVNPTAYQLRMCVGRTSSLAGIPIRQILKYKEMPIMTAAGGGIHSIIPTNMTFIITNPDLTVYGPDLQAWVDAKAHGGTTFNIAHQSFVVTRHIYD